MSKPSELRSFADEDIEAAGELLAARHRRHRAAEPLLPERYERADEASAAIEAAWQKPGATGFVAVRGGRLAGYLIGASDEESSWDPNEWIDHRGFAVEEPELVRDLYAVLAERSVGEGRNRHYVLVPASDRGLLEAWYRLGFGQQQAYGIREVRGEPWPEGVREATADDVDALLRLALAISRHHAGSPVFSDNAARQVEGAAASSGEIRAQIEADIAADEIGTLVAEVDGRLVGLLEVCPVELAGDGVNGHAMLARPEGGCFLAFAAMDPEARGVGRASGSPRQRSPGRTRPAIPRWSPTGG